MNFFGESSTLVIFGIILTAGVFVLHLIGFATPYWYKLGSGNYGLWQVCADGFGCEKFTSGLSSQFEAAQAMECLAFIAFLGALLCIIMKLFVIKDQNMLYIVISLADCAAGGLALLGVIIFGTMEELDKSKFHFSFAFCIMAALGAVLAGVMILLGRNK